MRIKESVSLFFILTLLFLCGCFSPKIRLFADATDPLKEFTLEGKDKGKVLLVSVRGFISDSPGKGFFNSEPGMVQTIVSQLEKAEKDSEIKAILLKIDSPGGSVTASDLLYHEIMEFKKRTGVKLVVSMMDLTASGAYYISLPADLIMAHPTTITGSVGVIFMRPRVSGLMEKIGMNVEVNKSGKNKDMASPFRESGEEEQKILQSLVESLGKRFISLVAKHRKPGHEALANISDARICLAEEALQLGLIDEIGYLSDAVSRAKTMAGLPEDAKVIVYRRSEYPEDNFYNTAGAASDSQGFSLVNINLPDILSGLHSGFYYMWLPGERY